MPLLSTLAPYAGGGAMAFWAGTNVFQTGKISADNARSLEWQKQRYFLDRDQELFERAQWLTEQENREEDYNRSLFQTGMIQAYDQQGQAHQSAMQQADLNFQANMYQAKQAQIEEDRNRYLLSQAFKSNSYGNGKPEDRFTLAFILSELQNLVTTEPAINTEEFDPYYEPDFDEFDEYSDYAEFM